MSTATWGHGLGLAMAAFLCGGPASVIAAPALHSPRERILITSNWRFLKGDPPGNRRVIAGADGLKTGTVSINTELGGD